MLKLSPIILVTALCFANTSALAGSSVAVNCHYVSGIMLTNQYIRNFNVVSKVSTDGAPINRLNIKYNNLWYSTDSVAVPAFLSIIQTGVLLDRKMDICVTSTTTPVSGITAMELIGVQFRSDF